MRFLRQNTAIRLTVGPFFDKTDGITPETSLTVTNCKLTLMVDDGNVPTLVLDAAATASAGNNDMVHVTNDDAGFYDLELTAAQLNYVGRAMLAITDAANHCPVFHEFMIIPAKIYDSLILGTDNIEADAIQILGTAISAPATAGILDVNLKNIANAAVSTTTAQLGVNAVQISGDATAADNCEADYDGTGYAGGTIVKAADVTKISGDATAADNEEAFFDGTGYAGGTIKLTVDLAKILGTALTETSTGYLAAGFKKLHDVATPILAIDAAGLDVLVDRILTRAFGSVTYTGTTRCVLTALQALRNKFTVATGAAGYVVKKEDDSTTSWTGVVTEEGGVITAMDPDS